MSRARTALTRTLSAIWDFVVGDDPVLAGGVVLALVLTAVLAAWWVMPLAVLALLASSLRRAAR